MAEGFGRNYTKKRKKSKIQGSGLARTVDVVAERSNMRRAPYLPGERLVDAMFELWSILGRFHARSEAGYV